MSTDESTTPKPTPASVAVPAGGTEGTEGTESTESTPASEGGPETTAAAATGATRILVAEDEALIRLDLVEMLGEQGYDVVGQASNGEQAVELAKEVKPDLVIMDVKMPVLDGLSAAEQLHEAKLCPVIMLTAFSQTELVERARDAGVMAYIVKPFTADDLRPAIDIATSRWQELKALEAEIADLGERLETRKLVDRAKGVLMTQLKLSESDAFRWIQKTAMDRRLGMKEVAEAVINGFPAA
ncbi:ANTAR domain-containing response regulator [Terrabacter sp. C0L_2]|uniref:ANTAR domain-containing response regulator n=1 Tax=Terrabacter sp. C0L_2 TaxID=3108389 RepID=UPI003FCE7426